MLSAVFTLVLTNTGKTLTNRSKFSGGPPRWSEDWSTGWTNLETRLGIWENLCQKKKRSTVIVVTHGNRFPGVVVNLHPGRFSELDWTLLWATCSNWMCFVLEVKLDNCCLSFLNYMILWFNMVGIKPGRSDLSLVSLHLKNHWNEFEKKC